MSKLIRSVLFAPADRPKLMQKSLQLAADVIIFDLEDSVAPYKKKEARDDFTSFILQHNLNATEPQYRKENNHSQIAVRVNCPHTTEYGKDDIASVAQLGLDIIVLPKVEDISSLSRSTMMIEDSLNFEKLKKGGQSIWAMVESAKGVENASCIAQQSNIDALVLGCNDLTKDLKAKFTTSRAPLHYSMSKTVLAARAEGKLAIDGVYMDINDTAGLDRDCWLGKEFGFDGKSLIHPSQIDICNKVYSPSASEIEHAQRVIHAWEEAMNEGKSVAMLNGKLIEYLHVHEANAVLRMANDCGLTKEQ